MTASKTKAAGPSTMAVLRRLLGYMMQGKDKWTFWLGMIPRLISIVSLIFIPYAIGQVINEVSSPDGNADTVRPWLILAAIAAVLIVVSSVIEQRLYARLGTKAVNKVQNDVSSSVQRLSLGFFDRQPIGELTSRITNDTETVALFYEQGINQFIRAAIQILLLIAIMIPLNLALTVVSFIIVPIMAITLFIVQRLSNPAFALLQQKLGDLSGYQEETLTGHKVIISNRRREWAADQHEERSEEVFMVATRAFLITAIQQPIVQALIVLQTAIVLLIGGHMVLTGQTDLGTVTAFSGFVGLFTRPMAEIANLTGTILNAAAGGKRVFEIIDEEPMVKDVDQAADYDFQGGQITFDNVDFSYVPGRKILKHNTFQVEPGQRIGICGPTGAGKSTIMNILTRYYDIDSGTIHIDGQPLDQLRQRSLREQVGIVLQEPFLFTNTVMYNLQYAREGATEEECIEMAKQANAHDFIMGLENGYDTLLTERGANLSAGQRQMLTIARAMIAEPKILILDEATSNVDTRTEMLINEGLARLMEGRTSFVIAHRLSTIQDSDKIMVLNGGEIVEFAHHNDLMAAEGFYHALYMSQFNTDATDSDIEFIST